MTDVRKRDLTAGFGIGTTIWQTGIVDTGLIETAGDALGQLKHLRAVLPVLGKKYSPCCTSELMIEMVHALVHAHE